MTCEVTGKRRLGNGLEVTRIHRTMFFVFREIFLLIWNKIISIVKVELHNLQLLFPRVTFSLRHWSCSRSI